VKTILLGDSGVGKTAIALQAVSGAFTGRAAPTIGAGHYVLDLASGAASLSIWDTAGQENYRSLVPMYVREAEFALIVFDITSQQSFSNVASWARQVAAGAPSCLIFLVGNKVDLAETREVFEQAALSSIGSIGATEYIETSAVTGEGIHDLIRLIEDNLAPGPDAEEREDEDTGGVDLADGHSGGGWGSCC
jgi:small GTP-binding protein